MALETMRKLLTPQEEEITAGGSSLNLSPEQWAFMEKAPGGTELISREDADAWAGKVPYSFEKYQASMPKPGTEEYRSTVDYLDQLRGLAPATPLPPVAGYFEQPTGSAPAKFPSKDMLSRVAERSRDPSLKLIPVKNASVRTDAPVASASALPTVTSEQPAGKPDSSGKDGMVSPPSEGAGGDTSERDLYLARLAAQSAAGFGGMGAGKNIDMGIADTLGERLKQVQALRAKREEKKLGDVDERSNLNAAIDSYKQLFPDQADALERMRGSTNKPAVLREALNAWRQKMEWEKGKLPVAQATVAQKEAGVTRTLGQAATDEALRPGKVEKLQTAANLDKARIEKLRRETAANAVSLTRSAKAVETAGKDNVPSKDAIKYIRDDIKTAEKAITPTLENFKNIESASPGFAFGKPDKSIATLDFVAAEKLPAFANKARDLRSAVEALIVDIRHGSFGASLTAPEKASFETMLNTGLSGTVEQLSRAINMVRRKAAATAQTHFSTSLSFYPTETSQVLSSSAVFGPATREGGVYSDVWRVQAPPTAAGGRPEKPVLAAGKTALWDVAKGKWVSAPDAQVDAAVASGKYEK